MPGSGGDMQEITDVDFPVLFPLCEARIVYGSWVSFCTNEKVSRSRLCRFHLLMKRSRNGKWQDCEVVIQ